MPDLSRQLRAAVERVPAVSIDDAAKTYRRRRRRRSIAGGLVAVAVLVGVGVAGLSTGTGLHRTTVSVAPASAPVSAPLGAVVPGAAIRNVDFVSPTVGYGSVELTVGRSAGDGIAATTDGGVTWKVVTLPGDLPVGSGIVRVAFSSEEVGYAIGAPNATAGRGSARGQLEGTVDGAKTWTVVPGVTNVEAVAVSFENAYALAAQGGSAGSGTVLWRSADQGVTWQSSPTPITASGDARPDLSPLGHADLFVTSSGPGASGQLFSSTDAGRTWSTRLTPCASGAGQTGLVTADTDQDLWLVCPGQTEEGGQAKQVYRSADGGQHWTLTAAVTAGRPATTGTIPSGGYVSQLTALSDTTAYLGLQRGGILESTDSGRTWHQVIPNANATTYNLFDPTSGVALVDGIPWRTTNGTAWTPTP